MMPAVGTSSPAQSPSNVVLPLPEGPMIDNVVPCSAVKETPSSTVSFRSPDVYVLERFSAWSTVSGIIFKEGKKLNIHDFYRKFDSFNYGRQTPHLYCIAVYDDSSCSAEEYSLFRRQSYGRLRVVARGSIPRTGREGTQQDFAASESYERGTEWRNIGGWI